MASIRKFDTKVQHLKYKVLREVARLAWSDELLEHALDIPKTIAPGKTPTHRCCVYKERAILAERVKCAMAGNDRKQRTTIDKRSYLAFYAVKIGVFETQVDRQLYSVQITLLYAISIARPHFLISEIELRAMHIVV